MVRHGSSPLGVRVRVKARAGVAAPARAAYWSIFLLLSDRMLLSQGKVFQPVRLDGRSLVFRLVPGQRGLVVSGITPAGPVSNAGCSADRGRRAGGRFGHRVVAGGGLVRPRGGSGWSRTPS